MPYRDIMGRWCGFLDIEEKEKSNRFVRRYFILNPNSNTLDYYVDNPENLPFEGRKPVGSIDLIYISMVSDLSKPKLKPKVMYGFSLTLGGRKILFKADDLGEMQGWIEIINDAAKISVPSGEVSEDEAEGESCSSIGSYKAEVVGGVVVKTPIEVGDSDIDSSADELERDRAPNATFYTRVPPLKTGHCWKQGGVRKNWKRRYFILDEEGISYYKPAEDQTPIRTIKIPEIIESRISYGIHTDREGVFEVVTPSRVFYIQPEDGNEVKDWVSSINRSLALHRRRLKDPYPRPLSEMPPSSGATGSHSRKEFLQLFKIGEIAKMDS